MGSQFESTAEEDASSGTVKGNHNNIGKTGTHSSENGSVKSLDEYELVPDPPDGGYGWIIVLVVALQSCISISHIPSFGVYAVEYIEYFQCSTSTVSWIGSIMSLMFAPAGLAAPVLIRKLGVRRVVILFACVISSAYIGTSLAPSLPFLFFTIGVIGFCAPVTGVSGQVALQSYFHEKRARAISLSFCGPAVAIFIWPPITRKLIDTFGWRGSNLIMAGAALNSILCGALIRPPPMKKVHKTPKKSKAKSGDDSFYGPRRQSPGRRCCRSAGQVGRCCGRYLTRILMFCGWFGIFAGHFVVIVFTPIRAKFIGIDKTKGALLLSIVGIVGGVTRLGAGFVGDLRCVRRNAMVGAFGIYCGLLTCFSALFTDFEVLAGYCVLYGIGCGFYVGLQGACVYDVVGLKNIARGYSITSCALGISSFIAVAAAGYLYDLTGSPVATVTSCGIVQAAGGAFLCLIPLVQSYQTKRRETAQRELHLVEKSPVSRLKLQSQEPFTRSVEHLGPPCQ